MIRVGWTLLAASLLLGAVSLVLFFRLVQQMGTENRVAEVPLVLGEPLRTPPVTVDTSEKVALGVRLGVSSTATRRTTDGEHILRYSFPFRYRVLDADGRELASAVTSVSDSTSPRKPYETEVSERGGHTRVDHRFDPFAVPPPGRIVVEATIAADEIYHAEAEDLRLEVHDHAGSMMGQACGGTGALLLAILGFMAGVIVLVIGYSRRPPRARAAS